MAWYKFMSPWNLTHDLHTSQMLNHWATGNHIYHLGKFLTGRFNPLIFQLTFWISVTDAWFKQQQQQLFLFLFKIERQTINNNKMSTCLIFLAISRKRNGVSSCSTYAKYSPLNDYHVGTISLVSCTILIMKLRPLDKQLHI